MPFIRSLLKHFGIDRAVSYALLTRIWQIPSGIVTTLLIALCFQPEQQGVYYLILTLTGLQALADAGLINTLLHAASHESANARFDAQGFLRASLRARGRLSAMLRFALVWFLAAAILLMVVGIAAGTVLLQRQQLDQGAILPLALAVVMAGLALSLAPLIAILEGCDQIRTVNRFRLSQTLIGSVVVWVCLAGGAGLWTAAAAIATQLVCEALLVLGRYRRFFMQLYRTAASQYDWRREIWPLQWRIGVQSIARYLAFLPILPVLFDTQGPEVAGRYGMTWQVISNLMMVAYAYVRTRSPEFGRLIAEKRRDESNAAFKRVTVGSTLLLVMLVSAFWIGLKLLTIMPWPVAVKIADRFLSPEICWWFAVAVIPIHTTQCFAMYIRSQQFDPIWRVNLPSCLSFAVLSYFAARSGQLQWIAISMAVIFSLSTIALASMYRWYHRYFQAAEA